MHAHTPTWKLTLHSREAGCVYHCLLLKNHVVERDTRQAFGHKIGFLGSESLSNLTPNYVVGPITEQMQFKLNSKIQTRSLPGSPQLEHYSI